MALEQRAWADARQLKQLGRIKRSATHNNFVALGCNGLPVLLVFDARGGFSTEENPRGKRSGRDSKIRSLFCFSQISNRRATAPAAIRRGPVVTGALLRRGVEVAVARDAERGGGVDEGVAQLMALEVGDLELAFRLLEVRSQRVEIPSGDSPAVEVLRLAADVDQAVDR